MLDFAIFLALIALLAYLAFDEEAVERSGHHVPERDVRGRRVPLVVPGAFEPAPLMP